jgi:predicted outer membrane protein
MPPTKLCSYQLNKYSWIYALDKLRDVLPKDFDLQYRENAFVIRHKQAELPWLGQLAAE